MRANLELICNMDEEENEIKPLENLRLFSSSSGTTISSSTSINQTYIDSNPGPYTVEGGTEENPVIISIVSDLTITSIDTHFITNSDYITFYSDLKKSYIININDVSLYTGLVVNSSNSDVLIYGITIKGSNSTLNPGSGWIGGTNYGQKGTNNNITDCKNYLDISINSGGIVGSGSTVDVSNSANYGELLVNPIILSTGLRDNSRSGGIYGNLSKGNCNKCTNNGIINGNRSGGIIGSTNQTFNITNCTNYGVINATFSAGIIAQVFQNATLDNVLNIENCNNFKFGNYNINNSNITGEFSAGIIFSIFNVFTTIINCENQGTISDLSAGIVNQIIKPPSNNPDNYTLIKSCRNYGKLFGSQTGGIVRYSTLANIESCSNYGNIECDFFAGGIVYVSPNTTTNILNCNNEGIISGRKSGGIFGFKSQGTATNCTNNGEVSAENSGGIVGQDSLVNVINCTNSGSISGEGAGGIYGAGCGESVVVENCINNGEVGGNNAGGIFASWSAGTAKNCTNAGSITGVSAGGIYGEFSSGSAINCVNNGNLYGVNTRSI